MPVLAAEKRYASEITDFLTYITNLVSADPNAVRLVAQPEFAGGTIIKQLRELGYDGPIYTKGMRIRTTVLEITSEAATGRRPSVVA